MTARRYQAIVIGAGVAGASCLYHLARKGITRTLLIEQHHIATGSSGRSAAFVETQYLDPDQVRLCIWSLRLFEDMHRHHDLPFIQNGKLLLTTSAERLSEFSASIELQRQLGLEGARVVDPAEVSAIAPELRTDDLAGALWGPHDGYTDPPTLCQLLINQACEQGAEVAERTRVTGILQHGHQVIGVQTTAGDFFADAVVNAAGAWACGIGAMVGLPTPVQGYRRTLVVFDSTPPLLTPMPLVVEDGVQDSDPSLYFRDDTSRRLIVGLHTENHDGESPSDPDRFQETADWDTQVHIAELIASRLQHPDRLGLRGGWSGLYPLTPDAKPILGPNPQNPGLYNAVGLGGNGVQTSPALGAIVADLIVDGETSITTDAAKYSIDRFCPASDH